MACGRGEEQGTASRDWVLAEGVLWFQLRFLCCKLEIQDEVTASDLQF